MKDYGSKAKKRFATKKLKEKIILEIPNKINDYIRLKYFNIIFGTKTTHKQFNKIIKYSGSLEDTEKFFDIDISCGNGKFIPDLSDDDLEIYDGKVDLFSIPRFKKDLKLFKNNVKYIFAFYEYYSSVDGCYIIVGGKIFKKPKFTE